MCSIFSARNRIYCIQSNPIQSPKGNVAFSRLDHSDWLGLPAVVESQKRRFHGLAVTTKSPLHRQQESIVTVADGKLGVRVPMATIFTKVIANQRIAFPSVRNVASEHDDDSQE